MADRIRVESPRRIVQKYRRELSREIRKIARPVLRDARAAAPKRSGNLRRKIRMRVKYDADGPYVRITTSARRRTKNEETGEITTFRYGLAIQQHDHYLQKGLSRTPRR